jgi:hypothetical protein
VEREIYVGTRGILPGWYRGMVRETTARHAAPEHEVDGGSLVCVGVRTPCTRIVASRSWGTKDDLVRMPRSTRANAMAAPAASVIQARKMDWHRGQRTVRNTVFTVQMAL